MALAFVIGAKTAPASAAGWSGEAYVSERRRTRLDRGGRISGSRRPETETGIETGRLDVCCDAVPGQSDPNGVSAGQSLFRAGGGCGIRTREGLHPTRFPSLPSAGRQRSDHTARRRLQAWQSSMNPAEPSRMRLKLRLAQRAHSRGSRPGWCLTRRSPCESWSAV